MSVTLVLGGPCRDTEPAMSQQNVEIVRRWIEDYNRRDTETLDRAVALDAVGLSDKDVT